MKWCLGGFAGVQIRSNCPKASTPQGAGVVLDETSKLHHSRATCPIPIAARCFRTLVGMFEPGEYSFRRCCRPRLCLLAVPRFCVSARVLSQPAILCYAPPKPDFLHPPLSLRVICPLHQRRLIPRRCIVLMSRLPRFLEAWPMT